MTNNDIQWKWAELPVDEIHLTDIQKELCISFPNDFLELVKKSNGGYPSAKYFDLPSRKDAVLNKLLSVSEGGDDPSLMETYKNVCKRLPPKIIPFASDPFGNLICFDYRESPPSVCFWEHEIASRDVNASIFPVSKDFHQFLSELRN